jgi:Ser/Thr protein kinase RdoA (MazF antagonist)
MKPYNELSPSGKLRRLQALAVHALANYELNKPEVSYHGFDTNLLYRVTTANGERFMLRLAAPGWRTFEDLQAEAMWLTALAHDTTIAAPRVIPTQTSEYVLPISRPDIPRTWNATLMSWIPGRLLGHYLSEANLEKMGVLFAELHHHGATWKPPAGFSSRRFEHWLSRDEKNVITGGEISTAVEALPSPWRKLLEKMDQHVEATYAAIDRADLRVIHCDLWHDNIKLHQGVLHPFDFEDTVWGFRAHDIAMAMLDLLEATDEEQYKELLVAFRRGYEAHLTWPDNPIEPFQVGRLLWKINWVARNEPQWLTSMVERQVPIFEHYEHIKQVKRSVGN